MSALTEILTSELFLGIFIPSLLGVIGSFVLYFKRRKDRSTKLRLAFGAELSSMKPLKEWPEEPKAEALPTHDFTPHQVYSANADEIGLLSADEINSVVAFYSLAAIVEDHIDIARKAHADGQEVNFEGIHRSLNWLDHLRQRALHEVSERLDENIEEISTGESGWN